MLTTAMLLIFIVLFSTGVGPHLVSQSKAVNMSSSAMASTSREQNSLENTIGVITLNNKTKARRLQFFNEDGSLWYEFSFYDDDANLRFDRAKVEFQPFSFHLDYFVLALKCAGEDATRFRVVVNESTRLTKFIRRSDDSFRFQTWQQHILDLFAVGFDPSNNPLRTRPGGRVSAARIKPNQLIFHPLQIKGNWLKVRWNGSSEGRDKGNKFGYGWIKWKQNNQLLIELFYFS